MKSTLTARYSHTHIRQSPAPLQLLARLTRTLSDSGVRQGRQALPGRALSSRREERGDPLSMSPQRELRFSVEFSSRIDIIYTKMKTQI